MKEHTSWYPTWNYGTPLTCDSVHVVDCGAQLANAKKPAAPVKAPPTPAEIAKAEAEAKEKAAQAQAAAGLQTVERRITLRDCVTLLERDPFCSKEYLVRVQARTVEHERKTTK